MQLTETAARERFASARVIRLATVDESGRPHIVVTTFAVDGDRIYAAVDQKPKRTRDLRRLRNIQVNPAAALLADRYDDDWSQLWWARADGEAVIVSEPSAMAGPIRLLAGRYPQYRVDPPKGPVIAITIMRWTGWAYSERAGTSIT